MLLKNFLIFSCFVTLSYASLVGSTYSQRDLAVLKELEIDPSYITNYKLQKTYKNLLERSQKRYVKELNNASLFVPKIKDILRQEDIPSTFLYLAMAESYLKISARSHAKAVGIWQFIPLTAKKYGLRHDEYIDERMDLVKSTYAATKYLNYLHKKFDKWYLAALAYNCGEGRIIEALTRSMLDMAVQDKGNYFKKNIIATYRKTIKDYQQKKVRFNSLYKIYKEVKNWGYKPTINELLRVQKNLRRQYLPQESREYIRKIIALGFMNNRDFIMSGVNSHLLNFGSSASVATVYVQGGIHLRDVSKAIGMDFEHIAALNLHIRQGVTPFEKHIYPIYIPYSRLMRFNANKVLLKPSFHAIHIVKPGDTLSKIGSLYGVSYKRIKQYNQLSTTVLSLNQQLIIPKYKAQSSVNQTSFYFVKAGDTLGSISRKYNISLNKLMQDNNKTNSLIHIGDKIVINN